MEINNLKSGGAFDLSLLNKARNDIKPAKPVGVVDHATMEKVRKEMQFEPPSKIGPNSGQNPNMRVLAYNVDPMSRSEFDEAMNHAFKVFHKISNPMGNLVKPYQNTMDKLLETNPLLAIKDWDLGIDRNNEIVIFEGNDSLSSLEISVLTNAFDQSAIKDNIVTFQNAVIEASTNDFRFDKEPGSVAHYNLNYDNIRDVIRVRDFIIQESKHQFNSFESLRDQFLERGADFIKPEAADMRLVDVFA